MPTMANLLRRLHPEIAAAASSAFLISYNLDQRNGSAAICETTPTRHHHPHRRGHHHQVCSFWALGHRKFFRVNHFASVCICTPDFV